MSIYKFFARDTLGKTAKGTVDAGTEKEAAQLIRDKGLFLIRLTIHQSLNLPSFAKFHRVTFPDVVNFTRQLSTMITAGLQLQESLAMLKAQSANQAMTEMLTKISREIQGGGNFANALSKFPKQFPTSYIALIKAGESSGTLDTVLTRLADNLEKDLEFQSKVKGAMLYPMIIMIAMVVVFSILMTLVVPKLTALYVDFGTELPLATRILQAVSDFSVRFWWLVLILVIAGSKIFSMWKKTDIGQHIWDEFVLKIPLLGPLQKQILLVEFTRSLGLLVGAGVHILEALNILITAMTNVLYQDALKDITKKVEKGFPLGTLFAQYPMFPPILAQMIKVGEETGKMDESLLKLSTYFEKESDHTVKGLTTAIEPIIMVILGVGVGFIVFAIITPIYSLTSNFK